MSFNKKIQTLEGKYFINSDDLSLNRRRLNTDLLSTEVFDVVVIGGGIVGCAFLKQASQSGLKVALLEASHFSSGTSSRSSKLIHGGLRYLEQLNFGLVFESLKERNLLLKNNPHLVKPLPFIFPVYKEDRVPKWKMSLGFWLYDFLSMFKMGKHTFLNKKSLLQKYPDLKSKNLKGAFVYMDAQMNDKELTWANLLSACSNDAIVSNYMELKKINSSEDGAEFKTLQVYDKYFKTEILVKSKHVVLSLGPWTDIVGQQLFSDWRPLLNLSQGSHLCIKKERLSCKEALVINSNEDGRIIFIIPNQDYILVGTTETSFDNNPGTVKAEEEDIEYLLKQLNSFFPDSNLIREDCLSCFSGIRPLLASKEKSNSKTSREHLIDLVKKNITVVVGGKFTTHRKIAENILEHLYKVNPSFVKNKFKKKKCTNILPEVQFANDLLGAANLSIQRGMCLYLADFFEYHISVKMKSNLTVKSVLQVTEIFSTKYQWSTLERKQQEQSLEEYFKKCKIKVRAGSH